MRAPLCIVLAIAACDDPSTTTTPDARSALPADPPAAVIVQESMVSPTMGDSFTVPLQATGDGNLVIVAVALDGGGAVGVSRIVASDGRRFAVTFIGGPSICLRTLELWSLRQVDAGVTSVEVHLGVRAMAAAYVIEVSGLSDYPLSPYQGLCSGTPPTPDVTLPVHTGELVIAGVTSCGSTGGLDANSPLTMYPPQLGSGLARMVATTSGPFTAHWQSDTSQSCQFITSYR